LWVNETDLFVISESGIKGQYAAHMALPARYLIACSAKNSNTDENMCMENVNGQVIVV
jgi:hypothetical protein